MEVGVKAEPDVDTSLSAAEELEKEMEVDIKEELLPNVENTSMSTSPSIAGITAVAIERDIAVAGCSRSNGTVSTKPTTSASLATPSRGGDGAPVTTSADSNREESQRRSNRTSRRAAASILLPGMLDENEDDDDQRDGDDDEEYRPPSLKQPRLKRKLHHPAPGPASAPSAAPAPASTAVPIAIPKKSSRTSSNLPTQRRRHADLLCAHFTRMQQLARSLTAKSQLFFSDTANADLSDPASSTVQDVIRQTKHAFQLIDHAKSRIESIETRLTSEFVELAKSVKYHKLIENDEYLGPKLFSDDRQNGSDSDCEIVPLDPSPPKNFQPEVLETLKKIERSGITWSRPKVQNGLDDILITNVHSNVQKLIKNKEIILKKVPAKTCNDFFRMDSRNLKPPDENLMRRALISYNDVTSFLKSIFSFDWLDLADGRLSTFSFFRHSDKIYKVNSIQDECAPEPMPNRTVPKMESLQMFAVDCILNIAHLNYSECVKSSQIPKSLFSISLDTFCECKHSKRDNGKFKNVIEELHQFFKMRTSLNSAKCFKICFTHILHRNNFRFNPCVKCTQFKNKPASQNTDLLNSNNDTNNFKLLNSDPVIHMMLNLEDKNDFIRTSNNIAKAMLEESSPSESSYDEAESTDDENITLRAHKLQNADVISKSDKKKFPNLFINEPNLDDKENIDISSTSHDRNINHQIKGMDETYKMSADVHVNENPVIIDISSPSKPSPLNKGRKKIHKMINDDSLAESTKQAAKDENNRLKRVSDKEEMINSYTDKNLCNDLILDYNVSSGNTISVHSSITKLLKSHQIDGIKFMWNSCFESLQQINDGSIGSGCILAHCMGLGKTLQVIALLHTVLTNENLSMRTVLICCPLSTVLNWVDEFHKWLSKIPATKIIPIYELSRFRKYHDRGFVLEEWHKKGGVFIIGYEMFRHLTTMSVDKCHVQKNFIDRIATILLNPDIVVCDEGHLLKNNNTRLAQIMNKISTKRRIVLTGTPLQNNLKEYYCMVNFVKPNLLGSSKEYANRFEIPITNGQHRDSNHQDIKIMKKRSHVLHKMLEGSVQRKEASVLYEYLPPKEEYVLLIPLSNIQANLYKHYLNFIKTTPQNKIGHNMSLLNDLSVFQKIWTHPQQLLQENKSNVVTENRYSCFHNILPDEQSLNSLSASHKMTVALNILEECVRIGEKLIIFCTTLPNLDSFEYFLKREKNWIRGFQYFRMDGSVSMLNRRKLCCCFNNSKNTNVKLFLVSTRVGNLGINMIGANRVIIMDVSWNPSQDLQSIFRIYRFGQKKKCYIYRLVSLGTMEEKIYERSVTKQAVSCRVIDEKQIHRHYNMAELAELYSFVHIPDGPQPIPMLPDDKVLASVLVNIRKNYPPYLWSVHQHDSLLRDIHEEQLDESERRLAWIEYETEKLLKDKKLVPISNQPIPLGWYDENNLPQKMNLSNKHFTQVSNKIYPIIRVQNNQVYRGIPIRGGFNIPHSSIKHFKPLQSPSKRYQNNTKQSVILNKIITNSAIHDGKNTIRNNRLKNISQPTASRSNYILPNGQIIHRSPRKYKFIRRLSATDVLDLTNLPDTPEKDKTPKRKNSNSTPNKNTPPKRKCTSRPSFAKKLFNIASEDISKDIEPIEIE